MRDTFYRRPLPDDTIAFSGAEGRRVFAEALAAGGLDGYFPLAEQFHTQSEPSFCGLGSLVVALNALAIDPGRLWKGPWRWFGEELLDCCVPLERVRQQGLDLDELACLARCNGAEVTLDRADGDDTTSFKQALDLGARADAVLIVSYDRSILGQTGAGHFSPVGGYHRERDLALVLDVARFKYPPHWVSAERLWAAMRPVDPATGKSRGWLTLRPRAHGVALGFSITCEGESWRGLVDRLAVAIRSVAASRDVGALVRALAPLAAHVEVRTPSTQAHRNAVERARAALRSLPLYEQVTSIVGVDQADATSIALLAIRDRLGPEQRAVVDRLAGAVEPDGSLAAELANLRAQLTALSTHGELSGRAP